MKEFTCVVCGAKSVDRSHRNDRKFCGQQCRSRYWYIKRKDSIGVYKGSQCCKFNAGVSCIEERCESCGWNPAVAHRRKEAALEGI